MLEQAGRDKLKNRIEVIKPVLDKETFYAAELAIEDANRQCVINVMKQSGAIESIGFESREDDPDKAPVHRWQWVNFRDELKQYVEERDELPDCGHRPHIYNPADSPDGKLVCKFCGMTYDKEVVAKYV